MKPVTIIVDYRVVQTFLRALDSFVEQNPNDLDAKKVRQLVIETGAIMEIEALTDQLLELDSKEKHNCAECDYHDTCNPPKEQIN